MLSVILGAGQCNQQHMCDGYSYECSKSQSEPLPQSQVPEDRRRVNRKLRANADYQGLRTTNMDREAYYQRSYGHRAVPNRDYGWHYYSEVNLECKQGDEVCIRESVRRRRVLFAIIGICLFLLAAVLVSCFMPLLRGRTAFREVNGCVKDDKSFNANLKSNVSLWAKSKTFSQLHCSQEKTDFDESSTSESDEALASIDSDLALYVDDTRTLEIPPPIQRFQQGKLIEYYGDTINEDVSRQIAQTGRNQKQVLINLQNQSIRSFREVSQTQFIPELSI